MLTQRGIKLRQVGLFIPDPWRRQNIPEAFINWWFCKAAQRQGVGKWIGFLLFLQKQEILLLKREREKKNHSKIQFSVLMFFSSANECWYFVFCWAWGISAESKVNLTNWVKIASLFLKNNNKKWKKNSSLWLLAMVHEGLNSGIVSRDKIFLKKQKIATGKNFLSTEKQHSISFSR